MWIVLYTVEQCERLKTWSHQSPGKLAQILCFHFPHLKLSIYSEDHNVRTHEYMIDHKDFVVVLANDCEPFIYFDRMVRIIYY
jgi:hypothetical protein